MDLHFHASCGDLDGVLQELAQGVPVDARDEQDYTALAHAVSSSDDTREIIRHLIEAGADVHATVGEPLRTVLDLAASSGAVERVQMLLDAGADPARVSPQGYNALLHAVYELGDDPNLVPMIAFLAECGADVDQESSYRESPLSVASYAGRFDAVRCLLDAGADPARLGWTPLHRAVALGTVEEVQGLLAGGGDLGERDRWDRTAWLVAAYAGDREKARLIHAAGAMPEDRGREQKTALMACAERGDVSLLRWLIEIGADPEAADDAGITALMLASSAGRAECVRVLLDAGVDPRRRNTYEENAMSSAHSVEVVRALEAAGEDLGDINTSMKRALTGLTDDALDLDKASYLAGRRRRFGRRNPEVMDVAFWRAMVRNGLSAWEARSAFGDTESCPDGPVWCFQRFGMSFTELPDGTFVQIGGEHEDSYDEDFCIHNEVVVHDAPGSFRILGYPEAEFPPTDFHSATYVDGSIWIVGGLGYLGTRRYDTTPVYRLDCETWRIEAVEASGPCPGWIHDHESRVVEPGVLRVTGGKVCAALDGQEILVTNEDRFHLRLFDLTWHRT